MPEKIAQLEAALKIDESHPSTHQFSGEEY